MALIAGVDEAGRGPLAGPVIAAAVILDHNCPINGLADSKQLSPKRRTALEKEIKQHSIAWAIGRAEVEEIDRLNILQATLLAMSRAINGLSRKPTRVLVDGPHCPSISCPVEGIIKGDQTVAAISAASILAKVTMDLEMLDKEKDFPGYGFAKHKGYPTAAHIQALEVLGVTPIHRRSFGPVRRVLQDI